MSSGLSRNRISAVHESKEGSHSGAETLLDLQRIHGNGFVQRLVQRKLAISYRGGRNEQEIEPSADAVVRKNDSRSFVPSITRYAEQGIQRMCPQCEEKMQRQTVTESEETREEELQTMRQPEEEEKKLPRQVAPGVTRRMAYDHGEDRTHTNGEAVRSGRFVNAAAFTVDKDSGFAGRHDVPAATEGRRFLAHGQAHVVRQTRMQERSNELLGGSLGGRNSARDVRLSKRRAPDETERQLDAGPLVQREPLGRRGGARKTHVVKRGESLSLIAGYPSDGWRERLDALIAANEDHPNIKNRTPDDPRYGWLEIGDVINIPVTLAPLLPPDEITCGPCHSDWETIVDDDHDRALIMLDTAISKLASYDGTNPTDVKDALERRFEESSSAFAMWINLNLRLLRLLAPMAGYQCRTLACGGMCKPNVYGWTPFCIPFTSIRVCEPFYFGMSDRMRSMGLIHEWLHKYGCNFDFGYCSGSDCPGGTTRSLFNADPWARLVLDIG